MKKIFLLLLFPCYLSALNHTDYMTPYFSPGIQLGINTNMEFFASLQITIGLVNTNFINEEFSPIPGLTIGKRFYYTKNKQWDSYNYMDGQIGTGLLGVGYGFITDGNKRYNKFKLFGGLWGLLSYDYINWDNSKHHFGIFGVLPIIYDGYKSRFKILS